MQKTIISLFVKSFCNLANVDYDFIIDNLQNFNNATGVTMIAVKNLQTKETTTNKKPSDFWQENKKFSIKERFKKPNLTHGYYVSKQHR